MLYKPFEESKTAVYIRVNAADKETAYNKVSSALGEVTTLCRVDAPETEAAFATKAEVKYGDVLKALDTLKAEGIEVLSVIRIGNL